MSAAQRQWRRRTVEVYLIQNAGDASAASKRNGGEAGGGVEAGGAVAHPAALPPGAARRRRQPRRGLPRLPGPRPRQGRRRRRHRRRPQPVQANPSSPLPSRAPFYLTTPSDINACSVLYPRHVQGICDALAETMKRDHGLRVDPLTDFAVCCGQSEAFAAAIFASSTPLLQPNGIQ